MGLDKTPGTTGRCCAPSPPVFAPRAWRALLICSVAAAGAAIAPVAHAADGGGFGDSTWVAPAPYSSPADDPATNGPRVAPPDHARPAETALRLPFRAAFLPLRLLARGGEALIGIFATKLQPATTPSAGPPKGAHVAPSGQLSNTTGPGVGVGITSPPVLASDSRFFFDGYWTWRKTRLARLRHRLGTSRSPAALETGFAYYFTPNRPFYGMGNFAAKANKSIFLMESGDVATVLRLGSTIRRQLRVIGGYSSISSRRGYDGSPPAADRFAAADVPFLLRSSRMVHYGLGGQVAALDDVLDPSRGVHLLGEVQEYRHADGTDVRYVASHAEARVYVPVFAARRVLAFQIMHDSAVPKAGSAPIPFYRLPESRRNLSFAGYSGGQFRDRHLVLSHLEYRWLLMRRIWAVSFAELGEVASTTKRLRIADVHEAYGLGLRWALSQYSVFRFEAAKGAQGTHLDLTLDADF